MGDALVARTIVPPQKVYLYACDSIGGAGVLIVV